MSGIRAGHPRAGPVVTRTPGVALPSDLTQRLFDRLRAEGVRYCHWKGNAELAEALAGEKDLDLFVLRSDRLRLRAALTDLGFKEAGPRFGTATAGVSHFYAFDEKQDAWAHVHLYDRLATGERFVESHVLPFEEMLLAGAEVQHGVRVPTAEADLVCTVIRSGLRAASLPDALHMRANAEREREKLEWLVRRADLEAARGLLGAQPCNVPPHLFDALLEEFRRTTPRPLHRLRLSWVLRSALRSFRLQGPLARAWRYAGFGWAQLRRRVGVRRRDRSLHAGGALIAFTGPEATGKSTLVADATTWLGEHLAVRTLHAGKPGATLLTAPVHALLPLLRLRVPGLRTTRLERRDEGVGGEGENGEAGVSRWSGGAGLVFGLRCVMLAWERRRLLLRAHASARAGDIVICDRYPSDRIGAMDSPRLDPEQPGRGRLGPLTRGLARLEARLYGDIPPPDLVLRLTVPIALARIRNEERMKSDKEDDAYVAWRHLRNQPWQRAGTPRVVEVDTSRPLAETIQAARRIIWESL